MADEPHRGLKDRDRAARVSAWSLDAARIVQKALCNPGQAKRQRERWHWDPIGRASAESRSGRAAVAWRKGRDEALDLDLVSKES